MFQTEPIVVSRSLRVEMPEGVCGTKLRGVEQTSYSKIMAEDGQLVLVSANFVGLEEVTHEFLLACAFRMALVDCHKLP